MKFEIRRSFEKDAEKLSSREQEHLALVIGEISQSKKISDLKSCKKLAGHKNSYRIRMGGYRIGFFFENGIIELVRVLHRKDIYKYFP